METVKERYNLKFKWTVSKAVNTYGYNICSLFVNGQKVSSCNGGGNDMQGTCLGDWMEREVKNEPLQLKEKFYGLTFYNPNRQSSDLPTDLPTEKHTTPVIDGACGVNSVEKILKAVGYQNSCIDYESGIYLVERTLNSLN